MTDRLNMQEIQEALIHKSSITASLLVYLCIDDKYQNNIKYLEKHKCKVGLLKTILKIQIDDDEDSIRSFSAIGNPIVTEDMELLMGFVGEYAQKNGGQLPKFEEILEKITQENEVHPNMFGEIMAALEKSGYNPIEVRASNRYKTINKHCDDLVNKALNNRLDPLVGREAEVERIIEILAHCKKKNPLLVGDAGTGKTQIIEGLASAIAKNKVPDALKDAKIFSTSVARLMAGTKFRGDVEEKMSDLLAELHKHEQDTGFPTYLFIDEIHQIIGNSNGGGSSDGSNIANIIKPALANGELALIGATTNKEYKRTIQSDSALDRRFQLVRIEEPSDEETIQIINRGVASVLTNYHGVKFSKAVIEKAVTLSSKYILDKAQPDKSISILDSIGARLRTTESRPVAKVKDVERVISTITGTPMSAFQSKVNKTTYLDVEAELNKVVFGQKEAIKQISEIYERSKAGLSEEGQPIGSVLAIGPTGVGKTEIAKSLAEITKAKFFKINMGEYTESHSVAKLFGSPPGYVAHKEGGLLTNFIRKNPHTVLLLDEVEKAHTKVFESLLGIIDGAKMTDGEGNEIDFRNVMIIMTSNVGAASAAKRQIIALSGKSELEQVAKSSVSLKALQSTFSPEFRNKLTAIVNFNSLGKDEIKLVTDKFLDKAKSRLFDKKGISLEFTNNVYDYIAANGFQSEFGARPIKKLVETEIIDKLVKPLLKGELKSGDSIVFDILDEVVVYSKQIEETVEV